MSSSDWIIIPTIGENKNHVPNHQPVSEASPGILPCHHPREHGPNMDHINPASFRTLDTPTLEKMLVECWLYNAK